MAGCRFIVNIAPTVDFVKERLNNMFFTPHTDFTREDTLEFPTMTCQELVQDIFLQYLYWEITDFGGGGFFENPVAEALESYSQDPALIQLLTAEVYQMLDNAIPQGCGFTRDKMYNVNNFGPGAFLVEEIVGSLPYTAPNHF